MKPANLLRWYPRAWRERYGEELLALIQDNLDEGRPAWPLQLSVIWGTILMAGLVFGFLPDASPPTAPVWRAVALDVSLAAVAPNRHGWIGMTVEQDEDGWWCAHARLGPNVGARNWPTSLAAAGRRAARPWSADVADVVFPEIWSVPRDCAIVGVVVEDGQAVMGCGCCDHEIYRRSAPVLAGLSHVMLYRGDPASGVLRD
jgi:hypothetical protein